MKFTQQLMGYINIFEKITKAYAKDCFIDQNSNLVFIVKHGWASKAIGKQGANVKLLSSKFKKRIKIIEFSDDVQEFVKSALYPLKPEIRLEDDKLYLKSDSREMKAQLLGRDRKNLKALQELVNKFFKVDVVVE